jgi:hypothetical protein
VNEYLFDQLFYKKTATSMNVRMLLLSFLITNISLAQDLEQTYQELTARVNEINKYRDHEIIKLESGDVAGLFDGEAWVTGFYKNGIIQKITLVVENDICVKAFNYYFSEGKVIYITEMLDKFMSSDKVKSTRSFTGKYFFKDNKMFDREVTGTNRFDDQSLNAEVILLGEAQKNVDLLNRNKNNPTGMRN